MSAGMSGWQYARPPAVGKCRVCFAPSCATACDGCGLAVYCSPACRQEDEPAHGIFCGKQQQELEEVLHTHIRQTVDAVTAGEAEVQVRALAFSPTAGARGPEGLTVENEAHRVRRSVA